MIQLDALVLIFASELHLLDIDNLGVSSTSVVLYRLCCWFIFMSKNALCMCLAYFVTNNLTTWMHDCSTAKKHVQSISEIAVIYFLLLSH